MFGATDSWQLDYGTERAAHELLLDHGEIPAPALLAHGHLYDEPDSWPYLLLRRLPGRPWHDVALSHADQRRLARQVGGIIRRVHDLQLPAEPGAGRLGRDWLADHGDQCVGRHREWATLPPRLLAQIEDYVVDLERFDTLDALAAACWSPG